MPMPMPIMAASEVDQSGASTTRISRPVSALLTARPATATMIGRPAATTEPKVSSRMIAAAARPSPSEPTEPCSAAMMFGPDRPTRTPAVRWASAMSIIFELSVFGTSMGLTRSSRACAIRVRPSAEIAPGVVYGSSVPVTCGTVRSCASRRVTSARSPATPASAWTTTLTAASDWAGKRCSSRRWACWESEPGAE